MGTIDEQIVIQIVLDDGTVHKGFINIQDNAEKAGKNIQKSFSEGISEGFSNSLSSITKKLLAIGAAAVGLNKIKNFFEESIHESEAFQVSLNKFNQSLALSGQYTKAASADFVAFAEGLQATTKYTDQAILSGASLLQTIGRLTEQQLKPATQAALDLASAYSGKIGVDQAFEAVGKAAEGQVVALSRLGIKVKEGTTAAETYANALKAIQDRVSGSAASEVNTFAGAIAQTTTSFTNLQKTIGDLVVHNPQVIQFIKILSDGFKTLTEDIGGNKSALSQGLTNAILKTIEFSKAVNDLVIRPLIRIEEVGAVVFDALKIGIQTALALVAELGVGIGSILRATGVISEETFKTITTFADSTKATIGTFVDEIKTDFDEVGSNDFADRVGAQLDTVTEKLATAKIASDDFKNGVSTNFNAVSKTVEDAGRAISKSIQTGIVNVVVAGVSRVGASLAQGGKAFNGFLKQVLGIIGDMAISIGATLLAIGLGIEAIKASIIGLTGGPAIAAGLALILLGGLLKSLSGGEAGSTAAPAASVGSETTGGGGSNPELGTGPQKPSTTNTIIVQGDIFDSDDTGNRIVDLLRTFSDKNGEVLATA